MARPFRQTGLLLTILMTLIVSACGSSVSKAPPAKEQSSPTQPAASQPAQDAKPQQLQKVKYAFFPAAHSTVIFVAKQFGFFEKEGLDVEMIQGQSGIQMMNALISGDVQTSNNNLGPISDVFKQGKRPIMVYPYTGRMTLDLVVRTETLKKLNLSASDPIEKRMAGLKGMKIGITGPGSESDLVPRYFLKQAGLDPDSDATIISVNGASNLLAAMKTGQIDAFAVTPPTPNIPVLEGYGQVLISLSKGEVAEFTSYPYQGVVVMKEWAEKNPEVVVKFIRALMKADQVLRTNKEQSVEGLGAFLKQDKNALSAAYDALLPAWSKPEETKLTTAQVENVLALMGKVGIANGKVSANEGELWTNQYRDEALKGLK